MQNVGKTVGQLLKFVGSLLVFSILDSEPRGRSQVVKDLVQRFTSGISPNVDRAQSSPPLTVEPLPPPAAPPAPSPHRPRQRPRSPNLRGSLRLVAPGAPTTINVFAAEYSRHMMGTVPPAPGPYGGATSPPSTASEDSVRQIGRGTGVQTEHHNLHAGSSVASQQTVSEEASLQDIARIVNHFIEHTNDRFTLFRKDMRANDEAISSLLSGHHKLETQLQTTVEALTEIADNVHDMRALMD